MTTDSEVNVADFFHFARCFGHTWDTLAPTCSPETFAMSDLDRDGQITLPNFALFVQYFDR